MIRGGRLEYELWIDLNDRTDVYLIRTTSQRILSFLCDKNGLRKRVWFPVIEGGNAEGDLFKSGRNLKEYHY